VRMYAHSVGHMRSSVAIDMVCSVNDILHGFYRTKNMDRLAPTVFH
jgi:hypothetical protein